EIEALLSLASFAYEHPTFAVPEIDTAARLFDATALGHPLIPAARRITNDLRLAGDLRLLVMSGSNMSGKSTMLRSAGLAAVLALAHIADELAPRAANVHFEDHLEEGRIAFDYRMRPGVVEKSNALALMRAVGIEV